MTNYEEQDVIEEMRDERRKTRGESWYFFFVFVKEIQKRGTKFESSREFLKNLEIPQLSLAPGPGKAKIAGETYKKQVFTQP